ncbi:MAG: DUF2500 family protein [Planctomycetes bacterium]|nr:DUF2500 family protein [Planctomycetota bacterium]
MPVEVQRCPECSALLSAPTTDTCPYCGARFVAAPQARAAPAPGQTVSERVAWLARQSDVRAALASSQPIESRRKPPIARFVFGAAVIVLLVVMSQAFGRMSGLLASVPIGMAVVIGFGLVRSLLREQSIAATRADRRAAAVVAKRTHVSGGEHANTAYFVTLEFEDGTRQEFDVDGKQFGLCAEDDLGIAEVQGPRLHRFQRFATEA